jgi:hypothetical protein
LASISGQVVFDVNADGIFQADEPGLSGWRVFVDADDDGQFDNTEVTAQTDASGRFTLQGLPAGTHQVLQEQQAGWHRTSPGGNGQHSVTVAGDQDAGGINFLNQRIVATLSGRIVNDFSNDGTVAGDEPGLAGWRAYVDTNGSQAYDDGEPTALTDPDGRYAIEVWTAGPQTVAQVLPTGWHGTAPLGTGRYPIVVTANQDVTGLDFYNHRDFTPFQEGNLLVTRGSTGGSNLLLEYTPSGDWVQAIPIPTATDAEPVTAKDVVLDSRNRVQIIDGVASTRLTTLDWLSDPSQPAFSDTTVPGWTISTTYRHWGDIAAVGDYLFVNEMRGTTGTADGLIRFNVADLSYQRFSNGVGLPTDIAVGLDGLLYVLNARATDTTIYALNPRTLEPVRVLNILQRLQSLTADLAGNLYAVTDAGVSEFSPDGTLLHSTTAFQGDDLSISSRDGRLLVSSNTEVAILQATDTGFDVVRRIVLPGDPATNYAAFATYVQAPVNLGQGGGGGNYGAFTPGNILVSNAPLTGGTAKLYEYTPFGQQVNEYDLPQFEPQGPRDLVLDANGHVQIYNGTLQPRLTTLTSSPTPLFSDTQFAGWNTFGDAAFGGVATYGDYVYVTDCQTGQDTPAERGILRYDTATQIYERFHADRGDIIDITVGSDGLLYTLGPSDRPIGTVVRKYHPLTMQLLDTVTLPQSYRAIAVDNNGDIFAVNPELHQYNSEGVELRTPLTVPGGTKLADVDLDRDGRLLLASSDGRIHLTDRNFTGLFSFLARASDGQNFATFVSATRGFPKANWDAFPVDFNATNQPLDVLANDELQGPGPLQITSIETPDQGGAATLQDNQTLLYTPAANFVGVETLRYTLSDGQGGTDEALVTISVAGNARYETRNDGYTVVEDTSLNVLPRGVLANDGRLNIFPVLTPGNFLVTHSPLGLNAHAVLQEWAPTFPSATLVREVVLPDFSGGFGDVRDVVLDRNGNVQVYNGTLQPRLTTYDPVADALTNTSFDLWNTASNPTFGGLATWRNFVYATDQRLPAAGDPGANDSGIVRYDVDTATFTRFSGDGDFIDLAVGLDGLLYALGPSGATTPKEIRIYDPASMLEVRRLTNLNAALRAIAVDAFGAIYAVQAPAGAVPEPGRLLYRYDNRGRLLASYDTGVGNESNFTDIDLSTTGLLLLSNANLGNTNVPGAVIMGTFGAFPQRLLMNDLAGSMKFAAWIQPPVAALNGPLEVVLPPPLPQTTAHGTVTVRQDGDFDYVPDLDFSGTDYFTYVAEDQDGRRGLATVTLTVTPVNDPPVLTPGGPAATANDPAGQILPLTSIINYGPGTTTITDADPGDSVGGIAVTEALGSGTWSFTLDGSVFVDFGPVSDDTALLLPRSAALRFQRASGAAGVATMSYRAWDRTTGRDGNFGDTVDLVCLQGGVPDPDTNLCLDGDPPTPVVRGSFSADKDILTITYGVLNNAPVILPQAPVLGVTDERTPFTTLVSALLSGATDPDLGAAPTGAAVTAVTGRGLWSYSTDDATYLPFPAVSEASALLLQPTDYLRYTPDNLNGETVAITYRAWDQTDGHASGTLANVTRNGGATAYSLRTDTAVLGVMDVNNAPVLVPSAPDLGVTDVLTPARIRLRDFVTGVTDVDRTAVIGGIAVIATTGAGQWAFSPDGFQYVNFPPVNETAALLLPAESLVRYTPEGGSPGTASLTYHAWDAAQGVPGLTADVNTRGGDSAFSLASDTATLNIKPVNSPPILVDATPQTDYLENAGPQPVLAQVALSDPDSPDFLGGSLTVSIVSGRSPDDRLAIREDTGITLQGPEVRYDDGQGAHLLGTYAFDGWNLAVRFTTPRATVAAAQEVLRAITFANVSETPTAVRRLLRSVVIDGDGGNEIGTATHTVTVVPVNDPPLAQDDTYTLFSGETLTVGFLQGTLANDADVERDPLAARLVAEPAHGTLKLNGDGSFTYAPEPMAYGIETFTYQASDGQADSAVATVTIRILLPGRNPSQPADVNADGYLTPGDAILIANEILRRGQGPLPQPPNPPPFLDFNGDGLVTYADVNGVADVVDSGGARPVSGPHLEFPQTPPVLSPGEFVRIRLQATSEGGSPLTTVEVGEVFYVEALVADRRLIPQGVAAAFLDIAYDETLVAPAGDLRFMSSLPLFATGLANQPGLVDEAGAGCVEPLADGLEHPLFRVPVQALHRGQVVFAVNAADQLPAGQVLLFGIEGPVPADNIVFDAPASVSIKGPPEAADDTYQVQEDAVLTVIPPGVLGNDRDDAGVPLTAALAQGPGHGTVTLNPDGSFVYTPAADFFGADQFTYRANNGRFDSPPAAVAIDVAGLDDPPRPQPDRYVAYRDVALVVTPEQGVLANDREVDQQPLVASLFAPPTHGSLNLHADGSFTYTPEPTFGGQDRFTYQVSDGNLLSPETTVLIDVLYGWQNPLHPVDINGDGYASPIDLLLIVNDQARNGTHVLADPPVPPNAAPPFYDYNNNGFATAFDGQKVLEDLLANGARQLPTPRLELPQTPPNLGNQTPVRFRLETTDAQGRPASAFALGEQLWLNAYVADMRNGGAGVFSAYVDVNYDATGLSVAGPLQYGDDFPSLRAGTTSPAGTLDEVGGMHGTAPTAGAEALLFRVPLTATGAGPFTLTVDPADQSPLHDVTAFGIDGAIPTNRVVYGSTTITVTRQDADNDGVHDRVEDGAPHNGDGNSDGTADRLQANVTSVFGTTGLYATFASPAATQLVAVQPVSGALAPAGVTFPLGAFQFQVHGVALGGATTVTIFPEAGVTANTYLRFGPTTDNPTPHWYPFLFDGTTGAKLLSDRIVVYLVDGGRGDDDLTANGIIVDPGAPGAVTNPWQNTALPADVDNNGRVEPVDALILINDINLRGPRGLPQFVVAPDTLPPFLDVSADGQLTSVDVLSVVNHLNQQGAGEGEAASPGRTLPAAQVQFIPTPSPAAGVMHVSSADAGRPAASPIAPPSAVAFLVEPFPEPVPAGMTASARRAARAVEDPAELWSGDFDPLDLESALNDLVGRA